MSYDAIVAELDRRLDISAECAMPDDACFEFFADRPGGFPTVMYVPQTKNYDSVLNLIGPSDVVCDMGAGDLRFAYLAANNCRRVYAVEMNPETMAAGLSVIRWNMPRNLIAVCADWRDWIIPPDVTVVTQMVNAAPIPQEWFQGRRVICGRVAHSGGVTRELTADIAEAWSCGEFALKEAMAT